VDRSRRGFSQIFLAFTVRHAGQEAAAGLGETSLGQPPAIEHDPGPTTQTNRHRAGGGTTGASAVGPATIATVVGGGVIGISWTALFLAHGRT
jgi:hypothetical protein